MTEQRRIFAPFAIADFRRLWTANIVSNFGQQLQTVGAAWLMTTLTASPALIALVQTATTLPIMLFSLWSGALADGFDRRRIMLAAQTLMLVASVGLAACAWVGLMSPWLLLAFTFVIGTGTALNNPSWQSSMGDLVGREDLAGAVILNSVGFNLMRSVGPALGGLIVGIAGAAVAFLINAVSYLPLIGALFAWRGRPAPSGDNREAFAGALSAGLRYVAMSPHLERVILRAFAFGLAAVVVPSLLPLVARQIGGGATTYGVLLGLFGGGAVGAAFLSARIRARFGGEGTVRLGFGVFAVAVALLALRGPVWLTVIAMVPAGGCWLLTLSLFNVTVQLSTPRWVLGRVLAIYQTATFGGMAAGSWLWGGIAEGAGVGGALAGAAVVLVAGGLAGLRWPLPEAGTMDLDPLDRFREPSLRVDLQGRSGPIMVMVDYRIDEADLPEFLSAMRERRRIRIRDGARRWTVLRDLETPDIWTECYHVATWGDYLRHNRRRTMADAENTNRLSALHRGDAPPRVHRMIERATIRPEQMPHLLHDGHPHH